MRLPFLKVQQDALVRARMMGRLLGIPEAHGIGLAVSLFGWAVDMTTEKDLTGQIADDNPAEVVAAAVGWTDDPEKLYRAMARVGFIEVIPDHEENGFDRVKGLDAYAGTIEKRANDRQRAALGRDSQRHDRESPKVAATSPLSRNESGGQTQTQTQTQTQKETKEEEEEEKPPPQNLQVVETLPDKPDEHWDGSDFFLWAQERRRAGGYVIETAPQREVLDRWWSKCRMAEGVTVPGMKRGFVKGFGGDAYWEARGFPFKAFVKRWAEYVRLEGPHAVAS